MLESSHASWLGASTSSLADGCSSLLKMKAPTWTQAQLKEAIKAVVTQKMRFTQASARYGIPKGTLYDNILGKTKRMMVLEKAGLTMDEETSVLEFCCDISLSPYNRRTRRSLQDITEFVENLVRKREPDFTFNGLSGFRWWWAFCKKHSIVSLYYDSDSCNNNNNIINNNINNNKNDDGLGPISPSGQNRCATRAKIKNENAFDKHSQEPPVKVLKGRNF